MFADLHIHSVYSDGLEDVENIEKLAFNNEVKVISITDHDTIEGVKATKKICPRVRIISGVEMTVTNRLHILGYFIDTDNEKLNSALKEIHMKRGIWLVKLVKTLSSEYKISVSAVQKKYKELSLHSVSEYLMNLEGCNLSKKEIYDNYFWNWEENPLYGRFPAFSIDKVIDLITSAHGIPILAHPSLILNGEQDQMVLDDLKAKGIKGIEVYHISNQKLKYQNYLKEYAIKNNLLITGGSDFHGNKNKKTQIGEYGMSKEEWEEFEYIASELK